MTEAMVGLTVVAVGTSLPELATSVVAARKGNADMAIGNVVGSNIFNLFWILGAASTISNLKFNPLMNTDIWILLAATLLFFLFTYTGKKHKIDRSEGFIFIVAYISYTTFVIIRG